ncbi:precorrin-6A/cobalt-precorrin-6A reductase [Lentibacter algarum]|uniref:precorrin-6A/cobalt-precorrin-6A reductase n=1 Tax=Lentibacter algarum TaxID=576131 RepID=UPI001C08EA19|nr:precorrin-6A/cobalt-precorrin-6A reductase [Lentibacter algarum]MBU2982746.1 precorrin-6A/cobalt-precorrin-6A reductase [Lentibacter algarum]
MTRVLILAGVGEALAIEQALDAAGVKLVVDPAQAEAVLDAGHPFDHVVSAKVQQESAALGVAYARFLRPEWPRLAGDNWVDLGSEAEAAEHVERGSVVFVATGREGLEAYANLPGCEVIARQIGEASGDFPFDGGRYLVGHPPFTVEGEVALFKELGIDWLILRNAGGEGAKAKLDAARELGLKVGMIRRPEPPGGLVFDSVEAVVNWAKSLI